jgi:putative tricarboxylic transport membrane protein
MKAIASGMGRGVACVALAAFWAGASQGVSAQAQWAPTAPTEIGVNCAPGCGPDRTARSLQKLFHDLGLINAVTVVNRTGGGGVVLYNHLNTRTDGHTIAIASGSLITNHIVGRGPRHDELTPLARLFGEYITVGVHADSPIKTGRDLIEAMKKNPGAYSFGVASSLGNSNHQGVASALMAAGIDVRKARTVVFNSGANAIVALLGGHVDVVPGSVGLWLGQLRKGSNVRIIAVASPQRLPGPMAQVPTWREQGVDAVVSNWRGMVGPAGMSRTQAEFWEGALRRAVATDAWQAELKKFLLMDEFIAGADFSHYLQEQHGEVRKLLAELGLAKVAK